MKRGCGSWTQLAIRRRLIELFFLSVFCRATDLQSQALQTRDLSLLELPVSRLIRNVAAAHIAPRIVLQLEVAPHIADMKRNAIPTRALGDKLQSLDVSI